MDKYLLQILLETKTIIIPGLGALTITNEETGEIMFMSYLKYDDGALVKYISEKENFSENDAKNLIAKYVSQINTKIAQGEDYEMFQFGKFFLKDGEIEFENWRNLTASDSKIEEKEIIEEDIKEEIPPVVVVETITETIVEVTEIPVQEEEIIHEADKSLEEILEETKEVEEEDVDEEYIPTEEAVEQPISKENSYTPPAEEIIIVTENAEEIPEVLISETIVEQTIIQESESDKPKVVVVKKKRKPIFWILITLIVLLLAFGIATILFYDQVKQYFPFMENQRTEVERIKPNAEELSEDLNESAEVFENGNNEDLDGTVTEETIEEPVAEPQTEVVETKVEPIKESNAVNIANTGNQYFVIGGAFEMKENADRYVAKLIADGNQSSLLGPFGNVYMVSIASFNSEAEAAQQLDKFKGISSNAWIFHKR